MRPFPIFILRFSIPSPIFLKPLILRARRARKIKGFRKIGENVGFRTSFLRQKSNGDSLQPVYILPLERGSLLAEPTF